MLFTKSFVVAAGLVALSSAARFEKKWDNGTVWVTDVCLPLLSFIHFLLKTSPLTWNRTDISPQVVTAYTTFCPVATTIVHANQTYTVTSATTLTITNCPGGCTISSQVPAAQASQSAPANAAPANNAPAQSQAPANNAAPAQSSPAAKPASANNGSPVAPATGTGALPNKATASPTKSMVVTGGAAGLASSFGAIVLGGAAALLL
jgi:hypothetical protein